MLPPTSTSLAFDTAMPVAAGHSVVASMYIKISDNTPCVEGAATMQLHAATMRLNA